MAGRKWLKVTIFQRRSRSNGRRTKCSSTNVASGLNKDLPKCDNPKRRKLNFGVKSSCTPSTNDVENPYESTNESEEIDEPL